MNNTFMTREKYMKIKLQHPEIEFYWRVATPIHYELSLWLPVRYKSREKRFYGLCWPEIRTIWPFTKHIGQPLPQCVNLGPHLPFPLLSMQQRTKSYGNLERQSQHQQVVKPGRMPWRRKGGMFKGSLEGKGGCWLRMRTSVLESAFKCYFFNSSPPPNVECLVCIVKILSLS